RRQSQQRRRGGPKRGLLGKGDGSRQQLGDVRRVDRHPRQLRADLLDEPILVRALVETGITEADRVGRQAGDQLAGERRGGGRVEPTADVDAYRNVRAEPETRRLPEELAQLLGLLAGGSFGLVDRRGGEIPPTALLDPSVLADAQVMRGRELADADERRPIGQHRPHRERLDECERIDLTPGGRMAEERLGLRRERKIAPELGDEERPYAEAVASKEQLSSLPVPDGDREVPVEALQASRAP